DARLYSLPKEHHKDSYRRYKAEGKPRCVWHSITSQPPLQSSISAYIDLAHIRVVLDVLSGQSGSPDRHQQSCKDSTHRQSKTAIRMTSNIHSTCFHRRDLLR